MPMPPDVKPQSKLTPAQSPSLLWRILVALGLISSVPSAGIQLYERVYPAKSVSKADKVDLDYQDLRSRLQQTEQKLQSISTQLRQYERSPHVVETPSNTSASATKTNDSDGEQKLIARIDKAEADLRLLHESLKRLDSLEHKATDAVNQMGTVNAKVELLSRKVSDAEARSKDSNLPVKVLSDPNAQNSERDKRLEKSERQIGYLIQKVEALSLAIEARVKADTR